MNGIVNIIKPAGMSSSDVVARMRRILGEKKVGHLGTLDPAAAGALPILVGKATRLFDYLSVHNKEYIAEFYLGAETDTLDAEGVITEEEPWDGDVDKLREILKDYLGTIDQLPPQYSAVKLGGKKAYDLARKGQIADIPMRRVVIHELELMRVQENRVWVRILCEKGTYVRSLCRDIARQAGTRGYLTYLLRTQSGDFRIEEGLTLAQAAMLSKRGQLPMQSMETALAFLPRVDFAKKCEKGLRNGLWPSVEGIPLEAPYRVYCEGRFFGVGHARKCEQGMEMKLDLYLPPEEA